MKRLLIATGLFAFTAFPVKAETWWLLAHYRIGGELEVYKVPMESENQCQAAGANLTASSRKGNLSKLGGSGVYPEFVFECISGR